MNLNTVAPYESSREGEPLNPEKSPTLYRKAYDIATTHYTVSLAELSLNYSKVRASKDIDRLNLITDINKAKTVLAARQVFFTYYDMISLALDLVKKGGTWNSIKQDLYLFEKLLNASTFQCFLNNFVDGRMKFDVKLCF